MRALHCAARTMVPDDLATVCGRPEEAGGPGDGQVRVQHRCLQRPLAVCAHPPPPFPPACMNPLHTFSFQDGLHEYTSMPHTHMPRVPTRSLQVGQQGYMEGPYPLTGLATPEEASAVVASLPKELYSHFVYLCRKRLDSSE